MRSAILGWVAVGFAIGVGIGAGVTIHQAERQFHDGESQLVVKWVYKNRVVTTPLWERGLVVGLGCGFLGAVAGHRLGAGGKFIPALVAALILVGITHYVETLLPSPQGRAAVPSGHLSWVFAGLLGAAGGAEASMRVRARRR